jgi:O-antigen/teichoic acid export membrane protein
MVKGFCETIRYISLVVFPILGGLAILSKPLVVVLWGEKWLPIVFPMQVLCLAAAIRCILAPIGTIFLCKRRPDIPFKFSIIRLFFTFLVVGSLSFFFGLNGVALGILFSIFPSFFLVFLSFKMLNASLSRFLFAFYEAAIATLISMVCALAVYRLLLVTDVSIFPILISAVIAGIIGYFASLFFFFYEIAKEIIHMIRTILLGYTTD